MHKLIFFCEVGTLYMRYSAVNGGKFLVLNHRLFSLNHFHRTFSHHKKQSVICIDRTKKKSQKLLNVVTQRVCTFSQLTNRIKRRLKISFTIGDVKFCL